MKKLLIIGYVWPEPNSSAAGSRIMQLISCFQQQNYLITFASPAQKTEHMVDLKAFDVESVEIKLNCSSFDDYIQTLQPDAVMYDRFMMEEQFGWRVKEHCPLALRILDTEDLFCLRHARHDIYKKQQKLTDSDQLNSTLLNSAQLNSALLNSTLLNSELAQREVAAIFRCDISIMISQVEIELLKRLFKVDASLLHYCPFMLTEAELNQITPSFEERENFMVIGNFRHAPNWDAVLWLKQQIWPLIHKQLPKAKLHVYGAYPPPKATALHDDKTGFLVKGWIDDAIAAMKSAKVCLAPLRFGAGIKGKLAEAMICATPSVTTDIGAESMTGDLPWPGAIANQPQQLADSAVELYQNKKKWLAASERGPKNARQLFNGEQASTELAACIDKLMKNLENHRQHNFIGNMLNLHHHKSTQYMSQWIDVKNQLKTLQEKQR